ncbi:MAG: 4'-phosphopantetheinyl transferase family protein [Frankia sp.]
MLLRIVPAAVAAAEEFGDPPEAALFPAEEALIARAVDKRRREFTTARYCARRALAELGRPPTPILRGERGAPGWPPGIVGSLTHCDGYRAAAVARAEDLAAIGIDAEPHAPLPDGVLESITRPEERRWLAAAHAADPTVCWDRLVFCVKEAVYKTWFPLTGRWLGFEDATVSIDPGTATFGVRLLVPGPVVADVQLDQFTGRWVVDRGLIVTAIALAQPASPPAG